MPVSEFLVLSLAMFAIGAALPAQSTQSTQSTQSRLADSAREPAEPTLLARDAMRAALFSLAALAVVPVDRDISRWSQRSALQSSTPLRQTATVFRALGGPGTLVLSVGTYGVGVLAHNRTVADIGLHATGAIGVASVVGVVLKDALGRARPYAVADSDAYDLSFGRGLRSGSAYQSLPSGHTIAAFALASVVSSEARVRWPHAARLVTPAAYGTATLVALSRIYNNDHWASDVVLGAGIGTMTGIILTRYQHAHPRNRADRWLLPAASVGADGSGRPVSRPESVALSWSFRF